MRARKPTKPPGKASLSYPISHGTVVNVVLFDFTVETWDHEKMVLPADPARVRSLFSTWGANSQALVEVSPLKTFANQSTDRPKP